MAWTSPMTFVDGAALSAAQLNTHLKENMQEVMPAKAFKVGGYFVARKKHTIVQRLVRKLYIATAETTTETDWTDLATVGPTVTVQSGKDVLVWIASELNNSTTSYSRMGVQVSGASTRDPEDSRSLIAPVNIKACQVVFFDDLTPGENTFTAKYRVSGGTGTFTDRRIIVWPF